MWSDDAPNNRADNGHPSPALCSRIVHVDYNTYNLHLDLQATGGRLFNEMVLHGK